MREPHNTHTNRDWLTHTHTHTHTHTLTYTHSQSHSHRNEGKTNNRGWGRGLVCVGPRGASGAQTVMWLRFRSGHKGVRLTKTKKTNRAKAHKTDHQFYSRKTCQSTQSEAAFWFLWHVGDLIQCFFLSEVWCLHHCWKAGWFLKQAPFVCQFLNQRKENLSRCFFFNIYNMPTARVNTVEGFWENYSDIYDRQQEKNRDCNLCFCTLASSLTSQVKEMAL